jgi:hypothetical protein
VKREEISLALNETTHALRYVESAARHFATDIEEPETGSKLAISVGCVRKRLTDARTSLVAAEEEIRWLIQEAEKID